MYQACIKHVSQMDHKDLIMTPVSKGEGTIESSKSNMDTRSLQSIIYSSPYNKYLEKRSFIELSDDQCVDLNTDWEVKESIRLYCAQLLSGGVIINEKSKEAVVINTIEVYGRTKSVDAHRERFGTLKDVPITASLPAPSKTIYNDLSVCTMADSDGLKLVIGTESMNALVNSSLRIDKDLPPSVGAKVATFVIGNDDMGNIRIFLDQEAVTKADLILHSNRKYFEVSNVPYQLRQLRSKFNRVSTYYLSRCNNPMIKSHIYYPYTTFTLCNLDGGDDSDPKIVSELFKSIAMKAQRTDTPQLTRSHVLRLKEKLASNKNKKQVELFTDDLSEIDIYSNSKLNKTLEKLTDMLSAPISTANRVVANTIKHTFLQ